MAGEFSFDWTAAGATVPAVLTAGGDDQLLEVSESAWWLQAAGGLEGSATAAAGKVNVAAWKVALICSESFVLAGRDGAFYAVDAIPHATTMAYFMDSAEAAGFPQVGDSPRGAFVNVFGLARALGVFARSEREAGNVDPSTLYDEDVVLLTNAAFTGDYVFLNTLMLWGAEVAGVVRGWMLLQWLLYPMVPSLDVSDPDSDAAVVLRLIKETARAAFPIMYSVSASRAVAELFKVEVPFQLIEVDITVESRIAFVGLAGRWANMDDHVAIVKSLFRQLTRCLPVFDSWAGDCDSRYSFGKSLVAALLGAQAEPDIDGFEAADAALTGYADIWNNDHTPAQNRARLLAEIRRRRGQQAGVSAIGGAVSDAVALGGLTGSSDYASEMAKLEQRIESLQADDASIYDQIEAVYHSGATPAIKLMVGKSVSKNEIPSALYKTVIAFSARLDEYVIDTIKRDDAGVVEPLLIGLRVQDFYKGAPSDSLLSRRSFFIKLYEGKVAEIDWGDFMHVIRHTRNVDASRESVRRFYEGTDLRKDYVKYVGRALHAIGLKASAENSLASVITWWESSLDLARSSGNGMVADCMVEVDQLMLEVWANAELDLTSALKTSTAWPTALAPATLAAFDAFANWAKSQSDMGLFCKRFKHTVDQMTGGRGRGNGGGRDGKGNGKGKPAAKGKPTATNAAQVVALGGRGRNAARTQAPRYVSQLDAQGFPEYKGWFSHHPLDRRIFNTAASAKVVAQAASERNLPKQCLHVVTYAGDMQQAEAFCTEHEPGANEHALALERKALDDLLRADGALQDWPEHGDALRQLKEAGNAAAARVLELRDERKSQRGPFSAGKGKGKGGADGKGKAKGSAGTGKGKGF